MPTTSVRVTDTQTFPPGTVLKAYKARGADHAFPGHLPPERGTAPPAAATVIAEGTMGNESVTLSNLEADTAYVVGGQVAAVWRWLGVRTEPESSSGGSSGPAGISEADADARYLQPATAEGIYAKLVESADHPATITASTFTVPDVSLFQEHHYVLGAASTAFTLPTPTRGKNILMGLEQNSEGGRGATFNGVKWGRGIVYVPSAAAHSIDVVSFSAVVGAWLGTIVDTEYS